MRTRIQKALQPVLSGYGKKLYLILDLGGFETEAIIRDAEALFPDYRIRVTKEMMDLLEKIHIFEVNLNDKIITCYPLSIVNYQLVQERSTN
ncbi:MULTISPECIES: CpXC domain-containing protein [Eubacterium]|uniref:CpXC domain-containing protein n=1 Tax=Eubacterium sp. AM05-23 TaxID=2292043 RepID=UPI001314C6F9|nr:MULTISPECIES: CpXC domain-containing protein [Eubacterium]